MIAARVTFARHAVVAAVLSLACALQTARAAEAQSPWGAGTLTQARIVLAQDGLSPAGTVQGAIEIVLPPGARTYWAFPGPNGFEPAIATAGSVNLGRFDVSWPTPRPFATSQAPGFESAGYRDGVTLPFEVAAADRTRPVALALEIDIGVCDDLCVPDFVALDLVISAGSGMRSVHAERIAMVRAGLPASSAIAGLRIVEIVRGSPGAPLVVRAQSKQGFAEPVLFVESRGPHCGTIVAPTTRRGEEADFHVAPACARGGTLAVILADGAAAVRADLPIRDGFSGPSRD